MQSKKGFTLIELMIVVAIIAILAMIAVPMYQRYIERSRNSAAQATLQQLALAEVAVNTAPEIQTGYVFSNSSSDELNQLASFGFRPDPNVALFVVEPVAAGTPAVTPDGFVAFAVHIAVGSQVFIYDNINASGTQPLGSGNATQNAYAAAPSAGDLVPWSYEASSGALTVSASGGPIIGPNSDGDYKVTTAGSAS